MKHAREDLPSTKELDRATRKIIKALGHLQVVVCVGLLEEIKTNIILNTGVVKIDGKI